VEVNIAYLDLGMADFELLNLISLSSIKNIKTISTLLKYLPWQFLIKGNS